MADFENALPPAGPAKHTPSAPKTLEIDRRDRCLLPAVLLWCFLSVDTILWSWPHGMGVTAVVFGWYVLLGAALGPAVFHSAESRVLLGSSLLLAVSFALASTPFLRLWNFLILLMLLPLHALSFAGARIPWQRPAMLWERLLLLLLGLFGRLGAAFAALLPARRRQDPGRLLAAALGTAGTLVLLGILVPVLVSADALFAAATVQFRTLIRTHFTAALWKLTAAAVMTPFVFGLLHSLRRPDPLSRGMKPLPAVDGLGFLLMLAALDGLYLLFLAVQSAGLFGGAEYLARRGISYARWARSGFFQMVGVTVVNLGVLLAGLTFSRRTGRIFSALRALSGGLILESLVLLISAAWRMYLYICAYGLSFKRLVTFWGMGLMALLFGVAARKIRRPDRGFFRLAAPIALAGWLILNCIPVDCLVAKDQVDRYLAGKSASIDVEYLLYDLSYDTLAQLERLDGGQVCERWPGDTVPLQMLIAERRAQARDVCGDWRSWNLSACLAAGR